MEGTKGNNSELFFLHGRFNFIKSDFQLVLLLLPLRNDFFEHHFATLASLNLETLILFTVNTQGEEEKGDTERVCEGIGNKK